jgi:hypothetical protein
MYLYGTNSTGLPKWVMAELLSKFSQMRGLMGSTKLRLQGLMLSELSEKPDYKYPTTKGKTGQAGKSAEQKLLRETVQLTAGCISPVSLSTTR